MSSGSQVLPGRSSSNDVAALRARTFAALRSVMSPTEWSAAAGCSRRLQRELGPERAAGSTVLVAFGGGKDSAYTITFVRAMQLLLLNETGSAFRLRVATNRHAGMPCAVMENIDRAYRALGITHDPDVESLLIDGDSIGPFDVAAPLPPDVIQRNRGDILMAGHRTNGDGRPTFCNACNLSVANAFGLAASHDGGVDVIITGDSPAEQRAYRAWIRGLAQRVGAAPSTAGRQRFSDVLADVDAIGAAYYRDLYGTPSTRVVHDAPSTLKFFSIYDETGYAAGHHWDLLTEFLGFSFDAIAFSFTESDCGNPTLMAHLRALRCERVFGRPYAEGLSEYVEFAVSLMRRKEFPERLIEMVRSRYAGAGGAERMRAGAQAYALQAFGLTDEQLVCMVHAPFAGSAARLSRFLSREHPHLLRDARALRAMLESDGPAAGQDVQRVRVLERISGLALGQLRWLYRRPLRSPTGTLRDDQIIDAILSGDPHKAVIRTRHAADGPPVDELISGR